MIAKHIPMRNTARSHALTLTDYLVNPQGKTQRIGYAFTINCDADDPRMAAREIRCTQERNRRARGDKTYHLLLSFRSGEEPDRETLRAIEKEVCGALGYGRHQRIAVIHRDTDNMHMHVVINKIHPRKLTILDPYQDHPALAKACTELERKYHLEIDNHEPTGRTASENRTADIEAISGEDSFIGYVRREGLPVLKAADSWENLHLELAKAGLVLALRGNGLIIQDHSGRFSAKGSAIGREFSKGNLEKRLGAFLPASRTAAPTPPEKQYRREPLVSDSGNAALLDEFKKNRARADSDRQARLDAITAEYRRRRAVVKAAYGAERLAARCIRTGSGSMQTMLSALREKRRAEEQKLYHEEARAKKNIIAAMPRLNWHGWLSDRNPDSPKQQNAHPDNTLREEYEKYLESVTAGKRARLDQVIAEFSRRREMLRAEHAFALREAGRMRVGRTAKRALYAALAEKRRAETDRLRRESAQARKDVQQATPRLKWLAWLQEQAKAGRAEALAALRARAYAQAKNTGRCIHGDGQEQASPSQADQPVDGVTKRGTVIYRVGDEAVRDDGAAFKVSREAGEDTIILALRLAKMRYGKVIHISHPPGDSEFPEKVLRAAVSGEVYIRFADPTLEARRAALMKTPATPTQEPRRKGMER